MVNSLEELSGAEQNNISYLINRVSKKHLDILTSKYGIKSSNKIDTIIQNVIDGLNTKLIPFDKFLTWLCHCDLEGNNHLYIFEPENIFFDKNQFEKIYKKSKKKEIPLYKVSKENLKNIQLVNVNKETNNNNRQLIYTFAAPSQHSVKKKGSTNIILENHVYLAYFIIDFKLKQIMLSMHPTAHLTSIYGESKGADWDNLSKVLLFEFKNSISKFNEVDPEWLISVLFEITQEYFYHNNPTVESKMKLLKKKEMPLILKNIVALDDHFKGDGYKLRLSENLNNLIENELINAYRRIEKKLPFKVFFHQSDKGITEFRANSKGKPLNHAEASEIVRLMWDNGEINSLGLVYSDEENGIEKHYPYKISKKTGYFTLKKTNTSGTKKEVIDDVFRKIGSYKQRVQSPTTCAKQIESGTNKNGS